MVEASVRDRIDDTGVFYAVDAGGALGATHVFRVPADMTADSLAYQLVYGAFSRGVERMAAHLQVAGVLTSRTTVASIRRRINKGGAAPFAVWLAAPTALVLTGGAATINAAAPVVKAKSWEEDEDDAYSADEDVERAYEFA